MNQINTKQIKAYLNDELIHNIIIILIIIIIIILKR
jgi:hypothetical protein